MSLAEVQRCFQWDCQQYLSDEHLRMWHRVQAKFCRENLTYNLPAHITSYPLIPYSVRQLLWPRSIQDNRYDRLVQKIPKMLQLGFSINEEFEFHVLETAVERGLQEAVWYLIGQGAQLDKLKVRLEGHKMKQSVFCVAILHLEQGTILD
jgi:hypothetical protein